MLEETFTSKEGKEIKKYLKLDFWEDDSRILQDVKVGQIYGEVKANVKSRRLKMVIYKHHDLHQFNLRRRL